MPASTPDDREAFRRAMRSYPTGVTVITAMGPEGPSGMTANAVSSLSLDPPMMLACFDLTARTLSSVEHSRRFGVNVLAVGHEDVARTFAGKQPEPEKWQEVEWSERHGIPKLEGTLVWIGCEVRDLIEGGDHLIAIGEVLEVEPGEGEPLVFYGGEYRRVSPPG